MQTHIDTDDEGMLRTVYQTEEFLSASQAGARLGVSRYTVYRMVHDGILGAVRRGTGKGRLAIPREEVDHYIAWLKQAARARVQPT